MTNLNTMGQVDMAEFSEGTPSESSFSVLDPVPDVAQTPNLSFTQTKSSPSLRRLQSAQSRLSNFNAPNDLPRSGNHRRRFKSENLDNNKEELEAHHIRSRLSSLGVQFALAGDDANKRLLTRSRNKRKSSANEESEGRDLVLSAEQLEELNTLPDAKSLVFPARFLRRSAESLRGLSLRRRLLRIWNEGIPVWNENDLWDMGLSFCVVFTMFITPYEVSFIPDSSVFDDSNLAVTFYFTLDILRNFNKGFYDARGNFVKDRKRIAVKYLTTWFLVDIISVFPFKALSAYLLFDGSVFRTLRVIRLTKLLNVVRGGRSLHRLENQFAVNYSLLQAQYLLLNIMVLMHWMACLFYLTIEYEDAKECRSTSVDPKLTQLVWECCINWLDCLVWITPESANIDKYLAALWWSTGVVMTTGSDVMTTGSDVFPVTPVERIVQMLMQLMSGVIYAYLIGVVCSVLASLAHDTTDYYEAIDQLNKYMAKKDLKFLNPELTVSMRMFYRYAYPHMQMHEQMKVLACPARL
ncbi:hypothetical protein CYMTET_10599 [Cymbomonas tetramitiformis]|uniref:Ion transport domain-containing protein n=1 Tax=Cymbomonas tetramitiformis TaxID=36881 RepID=A0AAE0GP11_9CHLO|nr:hypothetical protein CYMTET_10599 [Cymbomonas tetramitiformis]